MVVGGLVNLVFAPLLTRLLYEFIIVIFKIHSRLVNIDVNTSDKKSVQSSIVKQAVNEVVSVPITPPIQAQTSENEEVKQSEIVEPRQDFWNAGNGEPQFTKPDLSSVSMGNLGNIGNTVSNGVASFNFSNNKSEGLDLKDIAQKVPNWKLAFASFIVFISIMGSYANFNGVSFSIKDSAFGMFAFIAAVGMVAISAMSMKWIWYIGSFAITLVGTILALFDDRSIFSYAKTINNGANVVGSLFGSQASTYIDQARANSPSITSYLSFSFYLMILAMIYCGYCIINGQYKERISSPQNI
jgi:hypothetical protein